MSQLTLLDLPRAALPSLKTLREQPGHQLRSDTHETSLLDLLSALLNDPDAALRLLSAFPTLPDLLRAPLVDLQAVKGIGPAHAARLKAALELGRRSLSASPADRPKIRCPEDAAPIFLTHMGNTEQEELLILTLDTHHRLLDVHIVYRGTIDSATIRICELFRPAIRSNSAAIMIAHSHPSGDVSPSQDDVLTTRDIIRAGKLLGIAVLDHLVIGHGWISLRQRGLNFD
jgi:DNA repair protein RadC